MRVETWIDESVITELELFQLAFKQQGEILRTACRALDKKDTEKNVDRYTREWQKYEYLKWKIQKLQEAK